MDEKKLKTAYANKKRDIKKRLDEFKDVWNRQDDNEIFSELVFCLLTPQSKAKTCWSAVCRLKEKDALSGCEEKKVLRNIQDVRFKNKKAKYIAGAWEFLKDGEGKPSIVRHLKGFKNDFSAREWLVKNIKGIGYKEAGHFLRNIGLNKNLAILDRHILKNLKILNVVKDVPSALTTKKYLQIEESMLKFAKKLKMPIDHLDILFWSNETGEIFK